MSILSGFFAGTADAAAPRVLNGFALHIQWGALMWNKLFASADLLQKGMEASWLRNSVIRDNIANVETPGFKASDVHFEDVLLSSLAQDDGRLEGRTSRDRHIPINGRSVTPNTQPVVRLRENLNLRMDENNVDIESENAKLAQNSVQYSTLVTKLNSELTRIKLAVTEGR